MATSFIAHIKREVVIQIVRCDKTSGCKISYVEKKDWLAKSQFTLGLQ